MLKISFCIKKITDVSVLSNKIKLLTKSEDLICSWKKAILVTICYCNTQNLRKPINLYCDNVVSRGFPSLINMFTGKCEQTHENGQNLLRGNNMMLSMFRRIFVPFLPDFNSCHVWVCTHFKLRAYVRTSIDGREQDMKWIFKWRTYQHLHV